LYPFKEKLLQEIAEKKRMKEEEAAEKREQLRAARTAPVVGDDAMVDDDENEFVISDEEGEEATGDAMDVEDDTNPMAALLASARARASEYNGDRDEDAMAEGETEEWGGIEETETESGPRKDNSRRAFDKIFKEVVNAADVILYVLDARDPEGTRSKEVERAVMAADGGNKRLILIINKIDLIPPQILKGWVTHLRRSFPTLPLRASNPAPNARTYDHKQLTVKGTSEALFNALKAYSQSKQLKRAISVGVIGYPNVGKSSVINALTSRLGSKSPACPVGAEAGVTTSLREVKLDNKLKLLDCPGIVFPGSAGAAKNDKTEEKARLILLNAVPPKDIDDPIPAVKLLLKRLSLSPALLEKLYELYETTALHDVGGDTTTDFLVQVARKRGRLGRGGIPNLSSAAQAVITDWRDGRIRGWIDPPNVSTENGGLAEAAPEGDEKTIVNEWSTEFKLDGLWGDEEVQPGENMEV
jgi:nuclear GTP-binding protein